MINLIILKIKKLLIKIKKDLLISKNVYEIEKIKSNNLGKNGLINFFLKNIYKLDYKKKKILGKNINKAKNIIKYEIKIRKKEIEKYGNIKNISHEKIDVTLPGKGSSIKGIHPVSKTWEEIEKIFQSIGFETIEGKEIENDWYNFTSLNNPINHPARSMQDTFYINLNDEYGLPLLMRTHTSQMQVRYVKSSKPPIRIITSGKVFRMDNDSTHTHMFHQFEGICIAKDVSFANLKEIYTNFLHCFFEDKNIKIRFRPSFFPFTEPSAEIDIMFKSKKKNHNYWLEISGSGQIHPNVMKNFGINPEEYTGFAFGSGIERLAMLKYRINDLRQFYKNDLYFLYQFNQ